MKRLFAKFLKTNPPIDTENSARSLTISFNKWLGQLEAKTPYRINGQGANKFMIRKWMV